MDRQEFSFTDKHIYPNKTPCEDVLSYRNFLLNKFRRNIGLLLESKRPRVQHTTKGRLDTRKVYKYPVTDNIFKTYNKIPTSDTTFVLLIDGSGSMGCWAVEHNNTKLTRLEVVNSVCSAFGKAIHEVTKDEIKLEIFVKSAPCISPMNSFVEGDFVTLTRVYSNTKKFSNERCDRILSITSNSPIELNNGSEVGSGTPEFAVIPGLVRWMKKNIVTKNIAILNLTDGETFCVVGNGFQFRGEHTTKLSTKYLRGIPNSTLLVGKNCNREEYLKTYGKNIVFSDDGFDNKLFRLLMMMVNNSYE